jgi:hypothetical protein
MLNKWDLQREAKSLDKLISELSIVIVEEKQRTAQSSSENELVKEMEEALCQLRQARGLSHLMSALDKRKESVWGSKAKRRTSH